MHRGRVHNWLVSALVDNWPTKLVALIVAVILWFHVLSVEDPQRTQAVTVPVVPINEPSELRAIAITPETVELRLRGRDSALSQVETGRIRMEANLRNAKVGDNDVPLRVTGVPLNLAVVPGYPTTAKVEMDTVITRARPVNESVRGVPARGFVIERVSVEPNEISVRGATSAVRDVARAVAVVDVSGINQSAPFEVRAEARDNRNVTVMGVELDPPIVTVTVQVRELNVKYVPVRPVLGAPPPGYRVAGVRADPEIVTITSDQDLAGLESVPTLLLDISGLRGTKDYSVSLNVPSQMRVEGPAAVQVTVTTQAVSTAPAAGAGSEGGSPAGSEEEESDEEEDSRTSPVNRPDESDSGDETGEDGSEPPAGGADAARPDEEQGNRATTPPRSEGGGT